MCGLVGGVRAAAPGHLQPAHPRSQRGGPGGALDHLCAHGDAALAQASGRAGGRPAGAHLPGLVRSAIRLRGLGAPRQDPAPDVDGLSALVPGRARPAGRERHRGDAHRACREWPVAPCAAGRRRARGDCPQGRAGDRARGPGRALHPRFRAGPAARALGAFGRSDRFLRAVRAARRGDRRRRVGGRQCGRGARGRCCRGAPADPAQGHAAGQQADGHRHPRLHARLPGALRSLALALHPLRAWRADAAAARFDAPGQPPPQRARSISAAPSAP